MDTDRRDALDLALRRIAQFWQSRDRDCFGYFVECNGATVVRDSAVIVERSPFAPLNGYIALGEQRATPSYVESNPHTVIGNEAAFHEFDWEIRYRAYPHDTSVWWPKRLFVTYDEEPLVVTHVERGHSSMSLLWSRNLDRWQVCWMTTVIHASPDLT